jgi:hypothetical protein
MTNKAIATTQQISTTRGGGKTETQEQRARRLFDDMARSIGREAVNHLKTMYPGHLTDHAHQSKSWETSVIGHIRNGINWRMRPLLMAMIAMHREWEEEAVSNRAAEEEDDEQA